MANPLRALGADSKPFVPLLLAIAVIAATGAVAHADCDSTQFGTRLGPPGMAQPDGNIQTIAGDCTGVPNCEDFFDIELEDGDILYLSFCSNGGSANFESELSVFDGPFPWGGSPCVNYECGDDAELSYVAGVTGTHRIRISHAEALAPVDGNYVLAYSAPAGRVITPVTCGDGVVDADEGCDDGNQVDGDCCSRGCTNEAVDSACPDEGMPCTFDKCDGAGTCAHPPRPAGALCDDGEAFFCTADTCDAGGTCTHVQIPGCEPLPVCALPEPHPTVTFQHPKVAKKVDLPLVQAFVACNNPGGNVPNATTETGTVPSCYPAETHDENDGSPPGGWHWGPYGKGMVSFGVRCKDAGDVGIKLTMSNIVDGAGALVSGNGTFAIAARLTIMHPGGVPMTTIDVPLSFQFTVVNGVTKFLTSLNAMLTDQALSPLPNGFSFTLAPSPALDGLFEVRDSNANAFARPGIYLP